ncbi:hypothetical protein D9M68_961400 [compost metagenome]
MPGVGNPRLQLPIVGQQQQAFAVAIQPSGRVDARYVDKILERRPPLTVTELRQYIEGFVEQDQLRLGWWCLGHAARSGGWKLRPRATGSWAWRTGHGEYNI